MVSKRTTRSRTKKTNDEEKEEKEEEVVKGEEEEKEVGGVTGKKRTRSTRGKQLEEEGGKKRATRGAAAKRGEEKLQEDKEKEKEEEDDIPAAKKKTRTAAKKKTTTTTTTTTTTRAVKTTRKTTRGRAKKQAEEEEEVEEVPERVEDDAEAPLEKSKKADAEKEEPVKEASAVNQQHTHIADEQPEIEPEEIVEKVVEEEKKEPERPRDQETEPATAAADAEHDDEPDSRAIVEVPSSQQQQQQQGKLVVYDGAAPNTAADGVGEIVVLKDGSRVRRTSSLLAPTLRLTGHSAGVLDVRFSPDGDVLATAGVDSKLFLWSVRGECDNYMSLRGHKNAITCLDWAHDGEQVATGSADATVRCWDVVMGKQMKKYAEHTSIVNSCCTTRKGVSPMVLSGADDGTAKLWDPRMKESAKTYMEQYQLTSVCFSDDASAIFTGGIDGIVRRYDLRMDVQPSLTLEGHTDIVTGLRVSPDGDFMLSNAMDNTLRIWDLRPYAPADRNIKVLIGHTHGHEKQLLQCDWSRDGRSVASGSADACVYVWDTSSRRISYRLPGHKGCVNSVAFHPSEDIIASGANDSVIFLGELGE